MVSFYDRHIMPRLVRCVCGQPAIHQKRASLIPQATGQVLEVGCGGGLNFALYDAQNVTGVTGVDPSATLRDMAVRQALAAPARITVTEGVAESLPFDNAHFDSAVLTFTLCSVANPLQALGEIRRVLKPGGRLLFCEHGRSPDPEVQVWQGRVEPVWKRIAGGCHLTRPITDLLAKSGFDILFAERGYLAKLPRIAGWIESGTARSAA